MKIIFMGTPDFAAEALEALINAGHQITLAVTQPDRSKGRSSQLQFPPVKVCALKHNIPVFQPMKIKTPEAIEHLRQHEADIYIVAAFGQILSQEILDIPQKGSLCIHASLLPGYRGAAPIQHVIINGEEKTGVTIMQMDAGIDTGDMLYKKEVKIEQKDNFQSLHDKLMNLGATAVVEALALLEEGKLIPEKQNNDLSCYASIIKKEMGEIDFKKNAESIERLVRGMNPWPSAYTFYHGKQLKIWEAGAVETEENAPGEILQVNKDSFVIGTGKGGLRVDSLQLEGKKRMDVKDFLLGVKLTASEKMGR